MSLDVTHFPLPHTTFRRPLDAEMRIIDSQVMIGSSLSLPAVANWLPHIQQTYISLCGGLVYKPMCFIRLAGSPLVLPRNTISACEPRRFSIVSLPGNETSAGFWWCPSKCEPPEGFLQRLRCKWETRCCTQFHQFCRGRVKSSGFVWLLSKWDILNQPWRI